MYQASHLSLSTWTTTIIAQTLISKSLTNRLSSNCTKVSQISMKTKSRTKLVQEDFLETQERRAEILLPIAETKFLILLTSFKQLLRCLKSTMTQLQTLSLSKFLWMRTRVFSSTRSRPQPTRLRIILRPNLLLTPFSQWTNRKWLLWDHPLSLNINLLEELP